MAAIKRKVFISYYHAEDQWYKEYIETNFQDQIINKSVGMGDIDTDNSTNYIKRLIQQDNISDTSVVSVLIGPNTRKRKHVDWEISAGLMAKVGGVSSLIGVMLPELAQSGENRWYWDDMPARFADNGKTGYAIFYKWDYFINNFSSIVNTAFENKAVLKDKIDNSRIQMTRNLP